MKHLLPILAIVVAPAVVNAQGTCATALVIAPGIHTTGPVNGTPPPFYCVGDQVPSAGLWYSYTASNDTMVQLTTHLVGYPDVDTRFHVYTGTCGTLECYTGDDDSGPNYTSITIFPVEAGTTYTIAFDNYWNGSAFTFELAELYTPDPPAGTVSFLPTQIIGAGGIQGAVDMNNDGLDDVVSPGSTSFNIGHQLPGGGFAITTYPTSAAVNTASWSFAVGDWDSNGHRDLLYGGGSGATFMKSDGSGVNYTQVTFPEYIFCQRTNFVDINNDGHLDAFSCHDVDANVAFLNDGNGNLVFSQGGYGTTCGNYGSIWTDYNNDGLVDLFIAKCGCDPEDLLMVNAGNGTFNNVAPLLGLDDGHQSWSSAWGDFDNDGDMDAFIGSSGGSVHKFMRNNGDATFTDVTSGSGMDSFTGTSIEWTAHDFNNDGWIDILGGGALHYNAGNMTFGHDVTAPGNHAIGDLNNDGFLDIIGGPGYMRNSGNVNNWIKIDLIGTVSNRDAIGARVTVTSALGTQIRDVRSGDGFSYMSYIGAYFGLGDDTEVEQVEVRWPSGAVEVFHDVAINATHTYVEGVSVGMAEVADGGFTVAPNPVADVLVVSGIPANAQVEVIDAAGKRVMTERLLGTDLDVSKLAPGIYQLRVIDGTRLRVARFAKR